MLLNLWIKSFLKRVDRHLIGKTLAKHCPVLFLAIISGYHFQENTLYMIVQVSFPVSV